MSERSLLSILGQIDAAGPSSVSSAQFWQQKMRQCPELLIQQKQTESEFRAYVKHKIEMEQQQKLERRRALEFEQKQ